MTLLTRKLKLDPGTLLSGVLIVLAFPPHDLHFLIWFALAPWLLSLRRAKTIQYATIQGVWLSLLMSFGGFYWVAHSIKNYGGLPWPIALPMYGIFCFICQPQLPVFAWAFFKLRNRFSRNSWLALFSIPLIYCGIDSAIPKIFTDHLGHALYSSKWMVQGADLGGATLLTFVIVLFNEGVAQAWNSRGAIQKGRFKTLIAAACVVAVLGAYGAFRYSQVSAIMAAPRETPVLGVIQANIGDFEKVAARTGFYEAGIKIMENYLSLSEMALTQEPKPDVIVWPETAYPSAFGQPRTPNEERRDAMVSNFVKNHGVPLLFGGYDTDSSIRKDYNTTFFLTPTSMQAYHKTILLMFGETIPFYDDFIFLQKAFPTVGNFGIGPGPTVYEVPYNGEGKRIKFQPVICYEILFPQFLIDGANKGAEFILNVTNDSWFGRYGEPYLHLALSAFRSVETRLPQVRSTNTGITALIGANGDLYYKTPVFEISTQNMKVPITDPIPTLMKLWGDWMRWASVVLSAGLCLWFYFRRKTTD